MADVNANIGVNIDTSDALNQLKSLQRQIAQFHQSVAKSSAQASVAQKDLQKNFINSVNSIQGFSAELRTIKSTSESFTNSLEKNKFSIREYFRYAASQSKTFGRRFTSEFDTIEKTAIERVKTLQTQYIKLGRDASGALKAIAIRPTTLDMQNLGTQTQIAAQKSAIFNQLIKQGSTNLLNFGKNTQWAGRQLMVGFTLPLATLGTTASRVFMDMEKAAIKFKKVYGDLFTAPEETQKALEGIQELAAGYTKYGVAVSDVINLSSEAAAAGFAGVDLQNQTNAATKLSILGQLDYAKSLETTISLQNAFKISSDELASTIDFLNAVENQTVVALDDITTAVPKVAPVINSLGGDVKDLAFFLAAMKEGGVNASEGANALKSGLASLINPTAKATRMLGEMGVNITDIVERNQGDLKTTVVEFAKALDTLDPLQRARAIEQLFGKFQFARISTLFDNVTKDGTQASRVLDLASASVDELATLSDKELGVSAASAMNKFKGAVEDLKVALAPVGELFLKIVTPFLEFGKTVLEAFNRLPDGVKQAIGTIVTIVGGIGPVLLMTFGLINNGIANMIKFFANVRLGYLKLTGQLGDVTAGTQYLTMEQLQAEAAAASLNQAHSNLTQQFTVEKAAVDALRDAYTQAVAAGQRFATINPGMMKPGYKPQGFASGGIIKGPGSKTSDSIPAMLSNGEAVIPANVVAQNKTLIEGLISGNIAKFSTGGIAGNASQSAVVAFGAHQPFTVAHQMIAQMGMGRASQARSQFLQFTSMQGKSGRSIIDDELKRKVIAEALGVDPKFAKNPFDLMYQLSQMGYKDVELLLGEDRMSSDVWQRAAEQYGINLKKVGIPRPEGSPSGTAARAAAAAGNKKEFDRLLATGISPTTSKSVFDLLKNTLGKIKKFATGGFVSGPGGPKDDKIPAMLSNGEAVIPADKAKKYAALIQGMIAGNVLGFAEGDASVSGQKQVQFNNKPYKTRAGSEEAIAKFINKLLRLGNSVEDIEKALSQLPEDIEITAKSLKDIAQKESLKTTKASPFELGHLQGSKVLATGERESGSFVRAMTRVQNRALGKGGQTPEEFSREWNKVENGLIDTVRLGGEEITEGIAKATNEIDKDIHDIALRIANGAKITDEILEKAANEALKNAQARGGDSAKAAAALERTKQLKVILPGTMDSLREAGIALADETFEQLVRRLKAEGRLEEVVNAGGRTDYRLTGTGSELQIRGGSGNFGRTRSDGSIVPGERYALDKNSPTYLAIQGKVGAKLVDDFGQELKKAAEVNSPSQATKRASQGMVDGVTETIRNSKDEVAAATEEALEPVKRPRQPRRVSTAPDGTILINGVPQGTQATNTTGRGRVPRRASSGGIVNTSTATAVPGDRDFIGPLLEPVSLEPELQETKKGFLKFAGSLSGMALGLSSVTGILSSFGMDLGGVLPIVSGLSGALFALTSISQLLGQAKLQELASTRLKNVAGAMGVATEGLTGKQAISQLFVRGQGLAGLFKNLGKGLMVGLRFLGPIGIALSALAIAVPLVVDAMEKQKAKIEGLGATARLTGDALEYLAQKTNTQIKSIDLRGKYTARGDAAAPRQTTRDLIDELKNDEEFKNKLKLQINGIKQATQEQGEAALASLALDLTNKGFAPEVVQGIVQQIKDEAGRTDLNLSFLKLDTKGLFNEQALIDETNNIFNVIKNQLENNPDAKVILGRGLVGFDQDIAGSVNQLASSTTVQIDNLITKLDAGKLSAESFTEQVTGLIDKVNNIPNELVQREAIKALAESLGVSDAISGIDKITDQMLILKASATGVEIKQEDIDALISKGPVAIRVRSNLNKKIKTSAENYLKAKKALTQLAKEEAAPVDLSAFIEETELNKERISQYEELVAGGMAEADAIKIVTDTQWQNIFAMAAADDATNKNTEATDKAIETYNNWKNASEALNETQNAANYEGWKDGIDKQRKALKKLENAGVPTATALKIINDEMALAAALAAMGPGGMGLDAWLKEYEKYQKIADRLQNTGGGGGDKTPFQEAIESLKTQRKEIKENIIAYNSLRKAGFSVAKASELAKDSLLAAALASTKIGSEKWKELIKQIKLTEKAAKKTFEGRKNAFLEQKSVAEEYFDILERNVEKKFRDSIKEQEDAIKSFTKQIKEINKEIETYQEQIADIQRSIEIDFDRPIAALQEESSDLANDLTLMDKAADEITKRYEEQASALENVYNQNQKILDQQKSQLGLATALSSGDIAQAASIMQDMRAQNAEASRTATTDMINIAKEKEIEALRSATGMSRLQIEERQFAIGQLVYGLEEKKEIKLLEIRNIEDTIYQIQQNRLDPLQKSLDLAQERLDLLEEEKQKELDAINAKRNAWNDAELRIKNAEIAAGKFRDVIKQTKKYMNGILEKWLQIKDKKVTLTVNTVNTGGGGTGGETTVGYKGIRPGPDKDGTRAGQISNNGEWVWTGSRWIPYLGSSSATSGSSGVELRASGGYISGPGTATSDSIPAMLSKGEFVIKASAVKKIGLDTLNALNSGTLIPKFNIGGLTTGTNFAGNTYTVPNVRYKTPSQKNIESAPTPAGNLVYNYNLSVNVEGTNASPNDIANVVISKIRAIESQKVKGQVIR